MMLIAIHVPSFPRIWGPCYAFGVARDIVEYDRLAHPRGWAVELPLTGIKLYTNIRYPVETRAEQSDDIQSR